MHLKEDNELVKRDERNIPVDDRNRVARLSFPLPWLFYAFPFPGFFISGATLESAIPRPEIS